ARSARQRARPFLAGDREAHPRRRLGRRRNRTPPRHLWSRLLREAEPLRARRPASPGEPAAGRRGGPDARADGRAQPEHRPARPQGRGVPHHRGAPRAGRGRAQGGDRRAGRDAGGRGAVAPQPRRGEEAGERRRQPGDSGPPGAAPAGVAGRGAGRAAQQQRADGAHPFHRARQRPPVVALLQRPRAPGAPHQPAPQGDRHRRARGRADPGAGEGAGPVLRQPRQRLRQHGGDRPRLRLHHPLRARVAAAGEDRRRGAARRRDRGRGGHGAGERAAPALRGGAERAPGGPAQLHRRGRDPGL
ncbi:MAG: Peptidase, family M23, partial [uncultured Gemmatimonadetes bacterium]